MYLPSIKYDMYELTKVTNIIGLLIQFVIYIISFQADSVNRSVLCQSCKLLQKEQFNRILLESGMPIQTNRDRNILDYRLGLNRQNLIDFSIVTTFFLFWCYNPHNCPPEGAGLH